MERKMQIAVISFTRKGMELSRRIKEKAGLDQEITLFTKFQAGEHLVQTADYAEISYVKESLFDWTKANWAARDALLFIGACQIAVRAIAPLVKDKLRDTAVLVMDELGQFVIPVLSGHVGGANELAQKIAAKSDAIPVITTATDLNRLFAVDVYAKKNGLGIANREGIAKVSGALLEGESVSVLLSPFENERAVLQLCPKTYIVGIGCKKGKSASEIEALVRRVLERNEIRMEAVAAVVSIDKKADERGILEFAGKYGIPFRTFPAEELNALEGTFSASEFVKEQVGADNVCERAALLAAKKSGNGAVLIQGKTAENGVTAALARFWRANAPEWR